MTNEESLAEALEAYINPDDPQFDPEFTAEIMRIRPDWFTAGELDRFQRWKEQKSAE